jgi:hypothetical protein
MRHRRSRPLPRAEWPPALRHLIRAAELECPDGHAAALRDLTTLALRKVPARGLFDPAAQPDQDLFAAIEAIADAHLEFAQARRAWLGALDAAELSLARRDDIERTVLQLQSVSDTAHYYAGLAFGLTAVCVYRVS